MPLFMTVHRAPGLLKEQWVENAHEVYRGEFATFKQAHVNLTSGFIFTIYEATDREALIEQFETLGFPFEEINEIEFSQSFDEMKAMLEQMGTL